MKKKYRLFTTKEFYFHTKEMIASIPMVMQASVKKLFSKSMIEKIMLAVTEVNGCRYCNYYHTKLALTNGVSREEVHQLMSGSFDHLEKSELSAVLFAQHYADQGGNYDFAAYQELQKDYGKAKAKAVLAFIRMITFGNVYGIAFDAFQSRLKGEKFDDSPLVHEIGILFGAIILFPLALLHALIEAPFKLIKRLFSK